jgi:hypothetical protein
MVGAGKEIMEQDEKMFEMVEKIAAGFVVVESVVVRF